jgi:signal transduction histidine kinase
MTNTNISPTTHNNSIFDVEGEIPQMMRDFNWADTPLGTPDTWSEVLKLSVSLCLNSRFPLILWWGDELTMLYNDPYRYHLQGKHPSALGRPGSEVWSEIWSVIGPMLNGVFTTGKATYSDDLQLFLERNGYPEETYHTFSYSAVKDTDGKIVGIFTPVSETTERVISERRLNTLGDIGRARAENERELLPQLADVISHNRMDFPFAAFYELDRDASQVKLLFQSGLDESAQQYLTAPSLTRAFFSSLNTGEATQFNDLDHFFPDLPKSILGFAAKTGIIAPVPTHSDGGWLLFFSALSPHSALNKDGISFYESVAREIAVALKEVRAYEQERKRAQMLTELDRAKTEFFSNVSHEFRTPLTLLLGPVEDLLSTQETSPQELKRQLLLVQRNAIRLQKLVNALLDFARIEAGRAEPSFTETNLSKLTASICSSFTSLMDNAGLEFSVNCDPQMAHVFVDPDMWEKIVLNLVSNAFKFTEHGSITISLAAENDYACLKVSDSGIGIPEHELPNTFKRFHRIKSSFARTHEGSGIGLALIKELIEMHRGEISVESSAKGTTFTVRIPLGSKHLPQELINAKTHLASTSIARDAFVQEAQRWGSADESLETSLKTPSPQSNMDITILLVEDNADMRDYVHNIIGDRWSVRRASNGVEALALLQKQQFDLIVSDVMLPKMDGFELLSIVRADQRWSDIPVLLLSARAGEEATVEGLNAGATDYLVKPFSPKELIARIGSALDAAKTRTISDLRKEIQTLAHLTSHELQEPVRTIKSYQRLLAVRYQDRLGSDADEFIEKCVQSAETIDRMVSDLWTYAHVGRFQQQDFVEVDTNRELGSALEELGAKIRERKAKIKHASLPKTVAIEEHVRILFRNMLDNALNFSKGSPEISIGVKPAEKAWVFSVEDNGKGIDEMDRGKVFAMFTRLHAKPSAEGSGMGLAICKRIIDNQGGRIWVEANSTGGASFFFTLPCIPSDLPLESKADPTEANQ